MFWTSSSFIFLTFSTFLTFLLEGVETCHPLKHFIQFTSPEISSIFISIAIQHFFDVTTLSSIHLAEHIQRRIMHRHGLWPILLLNTREIFKRHMRGRGRRCIWSFMLESYSSICQVVLHLLSPTLFCQCGHLSFCSLRVVSRPRQIRLHVDPPSAPRSWVPWAHPLHLAHLELSSSLSIALSRRIVVVSFLSLLHAMPALHNPDNLLCDREPRCLQTTRRIFWVRLLASRSFCQLLPSLSTSIPEPPFATECHTSHPSS